MHAFTVDLLREQQTTQQPAAPSVSRVHQSHSMQYSTVRALGAILSLSHDLHASESDDLKQKRITLP
jgi:hypothetical protein